MSETTSFRKAMRSNFKTVTKTVIDKKILTLLPGWGIDIKRTALSRREYSIKMSGIYSVEQMRDVAKGILELADAIDTE